MPKFSRGALLVVFVLALFLTFDEAVHTVHAAGGCLNDTEAARAKGTVVLDPGHGGGDTGARYPALGLEEKWLVLDIANRSTMTLTNLGYRVCLTRVDDSTNPSNTERAQYANSVNGKVMVLIHLNGSTNANVNYTQTFWGKKNKDLAFSQHMYNALYPALDDVDGNGTPDGQVSGNNVGQFASGAMLKSTMPSTLTESVFVTNDAEAKRLADPSGIRLQQIADRIAHGVAGWMQTH
jgi:N-acetylmuramoyl-L-alanine amidase